MCLSSDWCGLVVDCGVFRGKGQYIVASSVLVLQYSSHGAWSLHNGLNI